MQANPEETQSGSGVKEELLDSQWLKELAISSGADDAGLADACGEGLKGEFQGINALLPGARTVVSLVVRVNPDALRSPFMGVVNREAAFANKTADDAASELSRRLCALGFRSVAVHAAFPMDTQLWPGKMWPVSHKTIAEEAGLGRMGHHRLVIHPKFGSSILLSAVVVERPASLYGARLAENPCDGCKLCVAACPTGSIRPDGSFSFINCATHNYRYRLGGFSQWVENIVESKNVKEYRSRVKDSETVSMWQSLAYSNNYTCLNCLAVCPAAATKTEEGGASLAKKLLNRGGPVFFLRGSDAEEYAKKKIKPERLRPIKGGTRPQSARGFIQALPLIFQPGQAKGLNAVYHFSFTGEDPFESTVTIREGKLSVAQGLSGTPEIAITADGPTWVSFLAGETTMISALLRRRIRIKGPIGLLKSFSRCFPK